MLCLKWREYLWIDRHTRIFIQKIQVVIAKCFGFLMPHRSKVWRVCTSTHTAIDWPSARDTQAVRTLDSIAGRGTGVFFSRLSWQIVRLSRKVDRHLGIYFRIKIYWCSSQQSTKVWFHFFLVPSSLWPRSDSIIARVDIRSHGQSRQRDASCPWDFLRCYPKRILIDHTITTKL